MSERPLNGIRRKRRGINRGRSNFCGTERPEGHSLGKRASENSTRGISRPQVPLLLRYRNAVNTP